VQLRALLRHTWRDPNEEEAGGPESTSSSVFLKKMSDDHNAMSADTDASRLHVGFCLG
jgi:hypothetical protein